VLPENRQRRHGESVSFDLLIDQGVHRSRWRRALYELVTGLLMFVTVCGLILIFLLTVMILLAGLSWAALWLCTEVMDKWPR
jgi:hypothetical protein